MAKLVRIKVANWDYPAKRQEDWAIDPSRVLAVRFVAAHGDFKPYAVLYLSGLLAAGDSYGSKQGFSVSKELIVEDPPSIDKLADLAE